MPRLSSIMCVLAVMLSVNPETHGACDYYEDFNDGLAQGWSECGYSWSVDHNEYIYWSGGGHGLPGCAIYNSEIYSNFTYQVKTTLWQQDDDYTPIGLLFWASPVADFLCNPVSAYAFEIHPLSGSYDILKITNGNESVLRAGTSSFIFDETNILKVDVSASVVNFYINGHFVDSIVPDSLFSGRIGLQANRSENGYIYGYFDDICVSQASSISSNRAPLQLFAGDFDNDDYSDIAIFRPSSGLWSVRGITRIYFGKSSDIAIPVGKNEGGLLRTGQTTTYLNYDDGYYEKGHQEDYTDNGDGTITDNVTKLMWAKDGDGQGCRWGITNNWSDAISWGFGLDFAGYTDWRLPNRRELESLLNLGRSNPAIISVFTNTKSAYYWTSTTDDIDSDNAWVVHFGTGEVDQADKALFNGYLRAVRGGR